MTPGKISCPSGSLGDWFQRAVQMPKSQYAQVLCTRKLPTADWKHRTYGLKKTSMRADPRIQTCVVQESATLWALWKGFLGGDMFPLCDRIMFLSLIMNLPLEDVKHRLKDCKCLTGVSDLQPMGWMWRRVAMNAAQHKIVNLLKTLGDFFLCVWLRVTMSLMCSPRQLFFQWGPETPKGWTSLWECPGDPYYPRS